MHLLSTKSFTKLLSTCLEFLTILKIGPLPKKNQKVKYVT